MAAYPVVSVTGERRKFTLSLKATDDADRVAILAADFQS